MDLLYDIQIIDTDSGALKNINHQHHFIMRGKSLSSLAVFAYSTPLLPFLLFQSPSPPFYTSHTLPRHEHRKKRVPVVDVAYKETGRGITQRKKEEEKGPDVKEHTGPR